MNKIKFKSVNEWILFCDVFTLEIIGAKKSKLSSNIYELNIDDKNYSIHLKSNNVSTIYLIKNSVEKQEIYSGGFEGDNNLNLENPQDIFHLLFKLNMIDQNYKVLTKSKIKLNLI